MGFAREDAGHGGVRKAAALLRAVAPLAAAAPGGDGAADFVAVVFGETRGRCVFPAWRLPGH